jgi:hypothetical protein
MSGWLSASVSYSAFTGAKNLKTVVFEDGIKTIPQYALRATPITEVIIPESVTKIEGNAFYDCEGLTEFIAPPNLLNIGKEVFNGCINLSKVEFNEGLKHISYYAFKDTAITSIVIPSTIETMSGWLSASVSYSAFTGAKNLKTVVFEDGIKTIPQYALRATPITEVIIPKSLEKIDNKAFYDSDGLSDVYYCGDEMMWSSVSIGKENTPLLNAKKHYEYIHDTHKYTAKTTKEPLCEESGVIIYSCYCGENYEETIPAKGHSFGGWFVENYPDCTENGLEKRACEECEKEESKTILATGHSYRSIATSKTCTTNGYTTYYCKNCSYSYTSETVSATGHNYNDKGICKNCGHNNTIGCTCKCHKSGIVGTLYKLIFRIKRNKACSCGAKHY